MILRFCSEEFRDFKLLTSFLKRKNTSREVLFLVKLHSYSPQIYYKQHFQSGVFYFSHKANNPRYKNTTQVMNIFSRRKLYYGLRKKQFVILLAFRVITTKRRQASRLFFERELQNTDKKFKGSPKNFCNLSDFCRFLTRKIPEIRMFFAVSLVTLADSVLP